MLGEGSVLICSLLGIRLGWLPDAEFQHDEQEFGDQFTVQPVLRLKRAHHGVVEGPLLPEEVVRVGASAERPA
jgi:hypothetical protein